MKFRNPLAGRMNEKQARILLALAAVTMFVLSAGAPGAFSG